MATRIRQRRMSTNNMPLGRNVQKNIAEMYRDNMKKGKERGDRGTPRSRAQMIAIAFAAARRAKK